MVLPQVYHVLDRSCCVAIVGSRATPDKSTCLSEGSNIFLCDWCGRAWIFEGVEGSRGVVGMRIEASCGSVGRVEIQVKCESLATTVQG